MSARVDVEAIVTASRSDIGKTRAENQDSCGDFLHLAGARLLILADGMGGHKGGRLASRTCVDAFARIFAEQAATPEQQLRAAFALANEEIYQIALGDEELVGMGTTGVALLVTADGCALVGWVGDSRAYRWRDGALEQLTEDHSLVSEWVRMGVLSPEQAETHPRRSELTRAVGVQPDVDPELRALDSRPGDRFLLCSDGLFGLVEDGEIAAIVGGQEPLDAVQALVDLANAAGGTDNVSVQIAVLPDARAPAQPSATEAPTDATPAPPAEVSAPPPPPAVSAPPPQPQVVVTESRSFHAPSALVGAAIIVVLLTGGYLGLTELGAGRLPDVLLEAARERVPQGTPPGDAALEKDEDTLETRRDARPTAEAPEAGSDAEETRRGTSESDGSDPELRPAGPGDPDPAVPAPGAGAGAPLSAQEPPIEDSAQRPTVEPVPSSSERVAHSEAALPAEPPAAADRLPPEPMEPTGDGSKSASSAPEAAAESSGLSPALTASSAGAEPDAPFPSLPTARESAPAAQEIPHTADFDLAPAVRAFVDAWLLAAASRDFALYHELGFPDPPDLFARTYARWQSFRIEAIDVDDARGGPGVLFLRATLSYVFEDENGRWRTEDEHRLILRETADGLRYEARWK